MDEQRITELFDYWLETAENDRDVMEYLYKGNKYPESLFFGHIILEKVLKALVVRETKGEAPYTHDLLKLAHLSQITVTDEEKHLLAIINDFNIRARYNDYKMEFRKKATKEYTETYLKHVRTIYTKLWQIAKQN